MTEDEQIQEMAAIITNSCRPKECTHCETIGTRESACIDVKAAQNLYNAGYRKVERGEWIGTREAFAPHPYVYNCSVCGFKISHCAKMAYKFCANCGADMRGEEK